MSCSILITIGVVVDRMHSVRWYITGREVKTEGERRAIASLLQFLVSVHIGRDNVSQQRS